MTKLVSAIVRGPRPYFGPDNVLYSPGQVAPEVPVDEVSTDDFREVEIEVEARNGDLRKRTVQVPVKFRPLGDMPTVAGSVSIPEIVTGEPHRLNVTDFLKGGVNDIEASIMNGNVDSHLAAIEQAEVASKNRKGIKDAITARRSSNARGPNIAS